MVLLGPLWRLRSRHQPDLPVELFSIIIDHLCAELESIITSPSLSEVEVQAAVLAVRTLRATGLACSLVSIAFLPLGRRILHSHLSNLDDQESFNRHPNLLSSNLVLAELVQTYHLSTECGTAAGEAYARVARVATCAHSSFFHD